jgi:hypothetical protein
MELILYLETIRGGHCYRVILIITKRRLDTKTKSVQLLNSKSTEIFAKQRCKECGHRSAWTWRPHHPPTEDCLRLLKFVIEPNWFPIFCVKNEKNPKPVSRIYEGRANVIQVHDRGAKNSEPVGPTTLLLYIFSLHAHHIITKACLNREEASMFEMIMQPRISTIQ